jgi:hypothetical protein
MQTDSPPQSKSPQSQSGISVDSATMEEIKYINWVNSREIEDVQISGIDSTLDDGIILLKILDSIHPDLVDWTKVDPKSTNKFKKVSNCNYFIAQLKNIGIPIISLCGRDIVDNKQTHLFSLLWLLMREEFIKINGIRSDAEIREWANQFVYQNVEKGELYPDEPDYEPLKILLYMSGEAEIFMNFEDGEEIDCPEFPQNFEKMDLGSPIEEHGRIMLKRIFAELRGKNIAIGNRNCIKSVESGLELGVKDESSQSDVDLVMMDSWDPANMHHKAVAGVGGGVLVSPVVDAAEFKSIGRVGLGCRAKKINRPLGFDCNEICHQAEDIFIMQNLLMQRLKKPGQVKPETPDFLGTNKRRPSEISFGLELEVRRQLPHFTKNEDRLKFIDGQKAQVSLEMKNSLPIDGKLFSGVQKSCNNDNSSETSFKELKNSQIQIQKSFSRYAQQSHISMNRDPMEDTVF